MKLYKHKSNALLTIDEKGNVRIYDFIKKKILHESKIPKLLINHTCFGKKTLYSKMFKLTRNNEFFDRIDAFVVSSRLWGIKKFSVLKECFDYNLGIESQNFSLFASSKFETNIFGLITQAYISLTNPFTLKKKKKRYLNIQDYKFGPVSNKSCSVLGSSHLAVCFKTMFFLLDFVTLKVIYKFKIDVQPYFLLSCSQNKFVFLGSLGASPITVFDISKQKIKSKSSKSTQTEKDELIYLSQIVRTNRFLNKRNFFEYKNGLLFRKKMQNKKKNGNNEMLGNKEIGCQTDLLIQRENLEKKRSVKSLKDQKMSKSINQIERNKTTEPEEFFYIDFLNNTYQNTIEINSEFENQNNGTYPLNQFKKAQNFFKGLLRFKNFDKIQKQNKQMVQDNKEALILKNRKKPLLKIVKKLIKNGEKEQAKLMKILEESVKQNEILKKKESIISMALQIDTFKKKVEQIPKNKNTGTLNEEEKGEIRVISVNSQTNKNGIKNLLSVTLPLDK